MPAIEIDGEDVRHNLPKLAPKLQTAVREAVTRKTIDLRDGVRSAVASIFDSTGPLYQSIDSDVSEDFDGATGTVYSHDVVYAAAQEYGGTWEIPEIFPKVAQALVFGAPAKLGFSSGELTSETIFTKHTKAHPVTLPARSYARSTLFRMRGEIEEEIGAAVRGAV